MIPQLRIQGFRCFQDIRFGPFARLNLISGRNNTGKTALLEALFLFAVRGSPTAVPMLNGLRGFSTTQAAPDQIWGSLFRNWRPGSDVMLDDGRCRLTLSASDASTVVLPVKTPTNGAAAGIPVATDGDGWSTQLRIDWKEPDADTATSRLVITPDGLVQLAARVNLLTRAGFINNRNIGGKDEFDHFGKVEDRRRTPFVVGCLRLLDERLQSVSVKSSGGESMFRADMGEGPPVPVALLGDGFRKLLSIAVLMARLDKGDILLVDEFESGIHHSALAAVWRAVVTMAEELDVQVFATTHSRECIDAAVEATSGKADRLALFKLVRNADGSIAAADYDHELLRTARDARWEVRG